MPAKTYADIPKIRHIEINWLGLVLAAIILLAILFQPFALYRPNRIGAPVSVYIWNALPLLPSLLLIGLLCVTAGLIALQAAPRLRLPLVIASLIALAVCIGFSASYLTPTGRNFARVSIGGCVWLIAFSLSLALSDILARMKINPIRQLMILAISIIAIVVMMKSGLWSDLSIMKEYASRSDAFYQAFKTHMGLIIGTLLATITIGVPLGILISGSDRLRAPILSILNAIQTIPSMALFGLLIAPLAWIAMHIPGASQLGISGIGVAPAFIALVAYALLPIVSSTLAGLSSVPRPVTDAADGMGMTRTQRLLQIDLPLAFPIILAGIRIVLIQTIGLAIIAGLVGGGGLGIFIFQGLSQTATDLVLLGTIPTVAMAFAASIFFDALIAISQGRAALETSND